MDEEERVRFASRILSNGQHLHDLINDLLDLSKVEAGMMDFRPERIYLADLLEEIELTMRVLADNNRIELKTLMHPGLREVEQTARSSNRCFSTTSRMRSGTAAWREGHSPAGTGRRGALPANGGRHRHRVSER